MMTATPSELHTSGEKNSNAATGFAVPLFGRVRSGSVGLDLNDFRRRNLLCGELDLRHQYLPGTITKRPPTSPKFFRKSAQGCGGRTTRPDVRFARYAPFSHFFMKLLFAAPLRGLPSALTALVSQVSWAIVEPTANIVINAAIRTGFILNSPTASGTPP